MPVMMEVMPITSTTISLRIEDPARNPKQTWAPHTRCYRGAIGRIGQILQAVAVNVTNAQACPETQLDPAAASVFRAAERPRQPVLRQGWDKIAVAAGHVLVRRHRVQDRLLRRLHYRVEEAVDVEVGHERGCRHRA